MTRTIVSVLTVVFCTLVATHARADARVTVHDFYGPNATRVREDVVNLLERQTGVTIVSKGQIEDAAKKLGVDAYSPEGRMALSRELQLSAWMTGMVQKTSGKLKLTVVVYDGAQHTRVGRSQLLGASPSKLSAEIKHNLWRKSGDAIMSASAPVLEVAAAENQAGAASAKVEQSKDEELASSEATVPVAALRDVERETNAERKGEALRAIIGIGSPYRSLAYSDAITSTLGDYTLSGAPMADINLEFHPARLATAGWASWFGLDMRAQIALTTPTVDRNGDQFKSRYDAFHLGLRMRVPVGQHYLSAFSGYGMNRFAISAQSDGASLPTPSVDYRIIRSGVGAELALSDAMTFGLDAAWLNFLSVGDIGKWFPRASAGGLEAGVFTTYSLTAGVFARAAVAYQRTFFDFHSRPGDKNVAGGATDQYLAVSLGAGVRL